jgi:uncharacterized protein YaaQ
MGLCAKLLNLIKRDERNYEVKSAAINTGIAQTTDESGQEDQLSYPERVTSIRTHNRMINRLITAVIQEQDVENAISSLNKLGFSITRLPSSGGFLGRRNATLLIGLTQGQEEKVTQSLYQSCRTRVEYVTLPLEGSPMPLPTPTPITVGGATMFAFDVERYEEL